MTAELPMPDPFEPPTLSIREVAEWLRIGRKHLVSLISAGRIGPKLIVLSDHVRRFHRLEFLTWIDAGCPSQSEWQAIRSNVYPLPQ